MTDLDLDAILPVVRAAAREAARHLLTGFRQPLVVEHKGALDLVTRFDRESETLLRERLGDALGFAIVGEEAGATGMKGGAPPSEPVFYVDPLDGTTNFVHGHPCWCVSIGLVVGEQPVLGVVLAPQLGLEWFGWVAPSGVGRAVRRSAANAIARESEAGAGGADIVEALAAVSGTSTLEDAMLATGFPYDRRTSPENNFAEFTRIKLGCQAVRRCGSAAIDLCLVADGTYDGYWEQRLSPWDIAAGIALVRAARGRVTDYEGGSTSLTSGRLIATNGAIHEELARELAVVRRARPDRAT